MVTNRLKELLFQKRRVEGRRLSLAEIARATGISKKRLSQWELHKSIVFTAPDIQKLSEYFMIATCPLFLENGFTKLISEKQQKEKRQITLSEINRATKLHNFSRLQRWSKGRNVFIHTQTINALCKYFEIEPGPFFQYAKEEKQQAA